MKKILLLILISNALYSNAQDCKNFYYLQTKKVIEMSSYDKRGDMSGRMVYSISSVQNTGAVTTATVQSQMFDKKGRTIATASSVMKCDAGVMMINMKMSIPVPQAEQFSQHNAKAEDFFMEYPTI